MSQAKKAGSDLGFFVLRLVLGGIMIMHGVGKLKGGGVQGFADYLGTLAMPQPYWLAVAVIAAEIGGGLLVVLGLLARIGALAIASVMIVAMWKVHWPNGFFMVARADQPGPVANGYEFCLALLGMALCIVLAGPGGMSVPLGKKSHP